MADRAAGRSSRGITRSARRPDDDRQLAARPI